MWPVTREPLRYTRESVGRIFCISRSLEFAIWKHEYIDVDGAESATAAVPFSLYSNKLFIHVRSGLLAHSVSDFRYLTAPDRKLFGRGGRLRAKFTRLLIGGRIQHNALGVTCLRTARNDVRNGDDRYRAIESAVCRWLTGNVERRPRSFTGSPWDTPLVIYRIIV